jgi:hypothetical protein
MKLNPGTTPSRACHHNSTSCCACFHSYWRSRFNQWRVDDLSISAFTDHYHPRDITGIDKDAIDVIGGACWMRLSLHYNFQHGESNSFVISYSTSLYSKLTIVMKKTAQKLESFPAVFVRPRIEAIQNSGYFELSLFSPLYVSCSNLSENMSISSLRQTITRTQESKFVVFSPTQLHLPLIFFSLQYPFPPGRVDQCAEWSYSNEQQHTYDTLRESYIATTSLNLPFPSAKLFLLARGASCGSIMIIQSDDRPKDDDGVVMVSVVARYNYPAALDYVKVCTIAREDDENGIAIFVSTSMH